MDHVGLDYKHNSGSIRIQDRLERIGLDQNRLGLVHLPQVAVAYSIIFLEITFSDAIIHSFILNIYIAPFPENY